MDLGLDLASVDLNIGLNCVVANSKESMDLQPVPPKAHGRGEDEIINSHLCSQLQLGGSGNAVTASRSRGHAQRPRHHRERKYRVPE